MTASLFDITPPQPRSDSHSDVVRRIGHKAGRLRELRGGQPTGREFYLAQLEDGRIVREFTDGTREPANGVPSVLIEDALKAGVFVEVES